MTKDILKKAKLEEDRIIGIYGGELPGPLVICVGAMHGNEPAGVRAIDIVLKMLEVEPIRNVDFRFNGTLVGMIGNVQAYWRSVRYIERDLNRSFRHSKIEEARSKAEPEFEEKELLEIIELTEKLIDSYNPEKVIFLDLHTTSSDGGIFTICRDREEDIKIASALHAPIVLGMLEGLKGTSLHYFTEKVFGTKVIPITFESGQHGDPLSINRAVAGIINCIKHIDCVDTRVVENHHEKILLDYSDSLPKVTRLIERHEITVEDAFEMKPGYKNFQTVKKGEVVAKDAKGEVTISEDGLVLMPLYQEKGEEGFFLIKEVQ